MPRYGTTRSPRAEMCVGRPTAWEPPNRDVVVIGASMGGVEALTRLLERLPADLPAVAVHCAAHRRSRTRPARTGAGPRQPMACRDGGRGTTLRIRPCVRSTARPPSDRRSRSRPCPPRAAGARRPAGDRSAVPFGRGELHDAGHRRAAHRPPERRDFGLAGNQALWRPRRRSGPERRRLRRDATERDPVRGDRSRASARGDLRRSRRTCA